MSLREGTLPTEPKGEFYLLAADGDDEVIRVIQKFYNDAIKANEEPAEGKKPPTE